MPAVFNRRPNIPRLTRRQDLDGLIAATTYREWRKTTDRQRIDVAGPLRRQAATELGRLDDPKATEALTDLLRSDPDGTVRAAAAEALRYKRRPGVVAALLEVICDAQDSRYQAAREPALEALAQLPHRLIPALVRALTRRSRVSHLDDTERWAVRQLLASEDRRARRAARSLIKELAGPGAPASRAADALVELAPLGSDQLIEKLEDRSVRIAVTDVIARRQDGDAIEALIRLLDEPQPEARAAATVALGELGDPLAAGALLSVIHDPDHRVRTAAATAFDKLGSVALVSSVAQMLRPLVEGSDLDLLTATVATLNSRRPELTAHSGHETESSGDRTALFRAFEDAG